MPRQAHPGASIDSFIARAVEVRLTVPPALIEVANILVDGWRSGEISDTLYSDRAFEIRLEKKYRETFAVAVAAVLSNRHASIETVTADGEGRERPDLLVRIAEREIGVEHTRFSRMLNGAAQ